MEEESLSFDSENEFEREIINIKEFGKVLRENTVKCLNEERKKVRNSIEEYLN